MDPAGGGDCIRKPGGGLLNIGDLLSWVMGRAQSGNAWLTVMGNSKRHCGGYSADAACIVLVETPPLDGGARGGAANRHPRVQLSREGI